MVKFIYLYTGICLSLLVSRICVRMVMDMVMDMVMGVCKLYSEYSIHETRVSVVRSGSRSSNVVQMLQFQNLNSCL